MNFKFKRIYRYFFFFAFNASEKKKKIFIRIRKIIFFAQTIISSSNSYCTKDIKLGDPKSAKYSFAKLVMDFISENFLIDDKGGIITKPHIKTAFFICYLKPHEARQIKDEPISITQLVVNGFFF